MADAQTSIAVEHLFKMTAEIAPRAFLQNGPQGTRAIVPVLGGTFEGPKLRGTIEPPAGDWVTVRADGSYKLDVRLTLRTDDGALILMTYTGIGIPTEGGSSIRNAPLFETGDPRYAWLNRVQAVGIGGRTGEARVNYEVYALT